MTTESSSTHERPKPDRGGDAGPSLPSRYVITLWFIALVVIVIDQATKAWATTALADGRRIAVLGEALGFVLVRNPGAAFSFATGQTWVFTAVAVVVTVTVVRCARRLGTMWWTVALGLVLGGAVGNLIDRLARDPGVFRGHVVDFIDYGGFFVGNVADIAIVGAAVAIAALTLYGLELDGTRGTDAESGIKAARKVLGEGQERRRSHRRSAPVAAKTAEPSASGEAVDGTADRDAPMEPAGDQRACRDDGADSDGTGASAAASRTCGDGQAEHGAPR